MKGTSGPGIYCEYNPCAFNKKGPVGLVVAILKGKCTRHNRPTRCGKRYSYSGQDDDKEMTANTIIGNAGSCRSNSSQSPLGLRPDYYNEIILQESCQCVPIIRFDASLVENPHRQNPTTDDHVNSNNEESLWFYHKEIQRVVDVYFNSGVSLFDKITKSDIFPDISQTYIALPMHYLTPRCTSQDSTSVVTHSNAVLDNSLEKLTSHNLPQHYFSEEYRDKAVALLLSNDSLSINKALQSAGCYDMEMNNPVLKKSVENLISLLHKSISSPMKTPEIHNTYKKAAHHVQISKWNSMDSMKIVGFTAEERKSLIYRHTVLECITEERHIQKIEAAAPSLVNDQIMCNKLKESSLSATIHEAGFNKKQVNNRKNHQGFQRHACDMTLLNGMVNLTVTSRFGHEKRNNYQNYNTEAYYLGDNEFPLQPIPNDTTLEQTYCQIHEESKDELLTKLNAAAKYLADHKSPSQLISNDTALRQTGYFTQEESNDTGYQIYIRIQANLIKRIFLKDATKDRAPFKTIRNTSLASKKISMKTSSIHYSALPRPPSTTNPSIP